MILSASLLCDCRLRRDREDDEDDEDELEDLGEHPRGEAVRPRSNIFSGTPAALPADPPKVAVPEVDGILIIPEIRASCSRTH